MTRKLTIENKYDIGDRVNHITRWTFAHVREAFIVNIVIEDNRFKYLCEFDDGTREWAFEERLSYKEESNV